MHWTKRMKFCRTSCFRSWQHINIILTSIAALHYRHSVRSPVTLLRINSLQSRWSPGICGLLMFYAVSFPALNIVSFFRLQWLELHLQPTRTSPSEDRPRFHGRFFSPFVRPESHSTCRRIGSPAWRAHFLHLAALVEKETLLAKTLEAWTVGIWCKPMEGTGPSVSRSWWLHLTTYP